MAFEIRKEATTYFPKRKPPKDKGYLDFVRKLPCAVTGRYGVEAAHISFAAPHYGSYGRARGTKAPDRWCLPLRPEEHRRQHSGSEQAYWSSVGIDPHLLALVIHGLFTEMGEDAVPYATAVINQGTFR